MVLMAQWSAVTEVHIDSEPSGEHLEKGPLYQSDGNTTQKSIRVNTKHSEKTLAPVVVGDPNHHLSTAGLLALLFISKGAITGKTLSFLHLNT